MGGQLRAAGAGVRPRVGSSSRALAHRIARRLWHLRLRLHTARSRGRSSPRQERTTLRGADVVELLLPHLAPGCSVMEVGGLWWSHGRVAFRAEELGATAVTEFDVMEPTPEFEGEQKRRDSRVRFVRGDALFTTTLSSPDHHPGIVTTGLDAAGTHDVVWCTGLLYHSPDPHRIVRNLLSVTGHTLVLGTKTVPEIPGLPGMAVFFPALTSEDRWVWCTTSPGVTRPFDRGPLREYANWWWGMTPTAFRGLVESVTGWEVVETLHSPRGNHHDDTHLVIHRS